MAIYLLSGRLKWLGPIVEKWAASDISNCDRYNLIKVLDNHVY